MSYQVLIVDDEEIVCRGLAQFVKWQNYGFAVAGTAYNADEALALLERTPVDVVFMDIRMPGKSGLELLQIIQKQYPHIKSVILSGYADFSYAQEAIRCGAVDYLTKPVVLKDIEALLERLRTEFRNCQRADPIRSNRVEALLLSAAKGYLPANSIKCDLPKLSYWYGLAMELADRSLTEEDIYRKKADGTADKRSASFRCLSARRSIFPVLSAALPDGSRFFRPALHDGASRCGIIGMVLRSQQAKART